MADSSRERATMLERLDPPEGASKGLAFQLRDEDGLLYNAYRYEHPAVAATVVLRDRSRDAFLLIERATEPYCGHYAFPGGFLDVGRESIEETAARELREETGVVVDPHDLVLVDVRSDPDRDPRDHVFDIGFYVEVDSVDAEPLDETMAIRWATAEELETLPLAFDHDQLWRTVRESHCD